MDHPEEIVAVALLTRGDIEALGSALKKVFPVDSNLLFLELLHALDVAKIPGGDEQ